MKKDSTKAAGGPTCDVDFVKSAVLVPSAAGREEGRKE
jgi:hypothetical protein